MLKITKIKKEALILEKYYFLIFFQKVFSWRQFFTHFLQFRIYSDYQIKNLSFRVSNPIKKNANLTLMNS